MSAFSSFYFVIFLFISVYLLLYRIPNAADSTNVHFTLIVLPRNEYIRFHCVAKGVRRDAHCIKWAESGSLLATLDGYSWAGWLTLCGCIAVRGNKIIL